MYELLAMPQEAVLPLLLPAPLCSSSSKLGAAKLSQLKRRLLRKVLVCVRVHSLIWFSVQLHKCWR